MAKRPTVTLTWGATPADLDLQIWSDTGAHVSYQRLLDAGIEHQGDDTSGPGEKRVLLPAGPGRYTVAVHRYTSDGMLTNSHPKVLLALGSHGDRPPIFLDVPTRGEGDWWHVAEIDMTTLEATPLIRLAPTPPWSDANS